MYLAKKNPLVGDRGGDDSVSIELREYTAARPNLINFLMGLSIFICREELQEDYGLQRPLGFRNRLWTIKSFSD